MDDQRVTFVDIYRRAWHLAVHCSHHSLFAQPCQSQISNLKDEQQPKPCEFAVHKSTMGDRYHRYMLDGDAIDLTILPKC